MKTVHVYEAQGEIEASLVKGFLESCGIQAFIGQSKTSLGWMFDETVATRLPKGIYVTEGNVQEAVELLQNRNSNL